jgi:hypothetical protein
MFSWLFFNLLDRIPWYPSHRGKLGIHIHFQKNLVPVSYLCALAFGLRIAGVGETAMAIFSAVLLPIYYVSIILLYFHFRDRSTLMPSYFSHNYYLKEKESPCSPLPSSDSVLEN